MAYLIGTAGHVDHGKTTLIAALTGIDADRLPEEKSRGMTIDLGFAFMNLEDIGRVSIVDVPGHERFIKNMLAGASGVDVALLCVAADEGVMPQTREHFAILRLLEARSMVVALTKCDIADSDTLQVAESEVVELLQGTTFESCPIVRVSATTGMGLDQLRKVMAKTLKELGERTETGAWFLPIDRVFTVAGHGTVVTGTLARGKVQSGAEAVLMPGAHRIRVRGLQVHGTPVDFAEAGQRTALNISGAKKEELERGQAIGAPGALIDTTCVNVRLAPIGELKHGQRIRLHLGSGEFIGKLFLFDHAEGFAQLRLESPMACSKGQRGVLRRYSPPHVIAGVEIMTPDARPRRKGDKDVIALLQSAKGTSDVLSEVTKRPFGAWTGDICEALGRTPQELGDEFERLKNAGKILSFAGVWLTPENYTKLSERLLEALMNLHGLNPKETTVTKSALYKASGLDWDSKAFDRLIARMADEDLIVLHGNDVRHRDFTVQLNEKQVDLMNRVLAVMESRNAAAPDARDISSELGIPPQAVEEMWRLGVATGKIVRLDEGLHYSKKTLEDIEQQLRSLGNRFTVAQFRDVTKSSRKFALPLLNYFDDKKVTRRVGDERQLLD